MSDGKHQSFALINEVSSAEGHTCANVISDAVKPDDIGQPSDICFAVRKIIGIAADHCIQIFGRDLMIRHHKIKEHSVCLAGSSRADAHNSVFNGFSVNVHISCVESKHSEGVVI